MSLFCCIDSSAAGHFCGPLFAFAVCHDKNGSLSYSNNELLIAWQPCRWLALPRGELQQRCAMA
jgi:hypothetical protein